ncbi:uncharacterized protein LOC126783829 [Argentina anserina]|uniref:uncharacterized protein LOC126783829 n=1 Tax=Argentina anserina TaxID=57926 RepID=UPI00217670FA|nr:uncharacterized protein LOC126783829 [Potentilla anserina]
MGICASTQCLKEGGRVVNGSITVKIVHLNGKLQELRNPVQASHILSKNPNCFLCPSESMFVDADAPQVPKNEELQLGQIYFLMPVSQLKAPLSLQDLCSLAIKASVALEKGSNLSAMMSPGSDIIGGGSQPGCCRVPTHSRHIFGMQLFAEKPDRDGMGSKQEYVK